MRVYSRVTYGKTITGINGQKVTKYLAKNIQEKEVSILKTLPVPGYFLHP